MLEGHASGHNLLSSTDSSKNDELTTHPGFVGILELFKQKSADLQLWAGDGKTAHEDVAAMKKSVIYKQLRIERGPQQRIAELTSELADKDQKISDISADKDQRITELSSQLAAKDRRISELSSQLAAKDQKISEIMSTNSNIQQANPHISHSDNPHISQLQNELRQAHQERQKEQDKYNGLCDEIINKVTTHAAYRDFRAKIVAENRK